MPVAVQGIFATHLHQLLDLDLDVPGSKRMRMETRDAGDAGGADLLGA